MTVSCPCLTLGRLSGEVCHMILAGKILKMTHLLEVIFFEVIFFENRSWCLAKLFYVPTLSKLGIWLQNSRRSLLSTWSSEVACKITICLLTHTSFLVSRKGFCWFPYVPQFEQTDTGMVEGWLLRVRSGLGRSAGMWLRTRVIKMIIPYLQWNHCRAVPMWFLLTPASWRTTQDRYNKYIDILL